MPADVKEEDIRWLRWTIADKTSMKRASSRCWCCDGDGARRRTRFAFETREAREVFSVCERAAEARVEGVAVVL